MTNSADLPAKPKRPTFLIIEPLWGCFRVEATMPDGTVHLSQEFPFEEEAWRWIETSLGDWPDGLLAAFTSPFDQVKIPCL
jgi:hypothetical protein